MASTYKSIAALQKDLKDGKTTVREVTKYYLDAIERLDKELNSFTTVNQRALEDAEKLDGIPVGRRGPLFGVPIAIKDQIDTAGLRTTYGSKACEDYVPPEDATIVRKLKEAGAVILGKTTLCDWATGFSSMSSMTGTTRHPIDPTRDPGGSSAGSGTAVGAELALAAIGGDTGGSIRLPSSFCGLVGVRMTPGRISRDGMSALVKTQDTPGPMCRTVEDAAKILDVLVGFDEKDDFTSINALTGRSASATQFQDAVAQPFLEGKRLGVLRQEFGSHLGINDILDKTLADLKGAGVELVDVEIPNLDDFKRITAPYVLRAKADINEFCASRPALQHIKLEDLYDKGIYHKGLELIPSAVKGSTKFEQSPHFAKYLVTREEFQRKVAALFAKHSLDAIIYPTCKTLAPKTQQLLDGEWQHVPNTVIGSQLLFTALSVPIGRAKDDDFPDDPALPVGLEILGVPLSEERILNIAAGVEALQSK
ncbi:hypothetical protein M409DRAFT_55582 [Zasmidium cellare ATCC 36951]|uniref:Amidase domain-containing protein n=1 Tax=Zasmidium cellare ATCC 36951 TaxID=1080233 RepID=A0A6A6CJT4_ZASCE|nr:uncharacterized protein M409DRAFT_55582 [Zasmidium cellare ATCC 36951]KAF2165696.1 hypothetical protein M409DRAFT_55582 [Zasmidium cellare ATCC 36951]